MTTIIGLDLGKFNSAACTFLTGDGEVRFQSLPTRIAALQQLFEREQPDLVVFEACAQAGFTADLCRELGLKFLVANTNGEAWKWKNVKRKKSGPKRGRMTGMEEHPEIRQLPQKKKKQSWGVRVMLVALGMFVMSWPLIYLIMSIPGGNDLIGFVLYLCGPLPILPAAMFLVGYGMFFCGR